MRRRLSTILCVLSLLLCLAVLVLWARSYYCSDEVRWKRPMDRSSLDPPPQGIWRFHAYGMCTVHGGLMITWYESSAFHVPGLRSYEFRFSGHPRERPARPRPAQWERLGFHFSASPNDRTLARGAGHPRVVIPLWSVCVLFALLPGTALVGVGARCALRIRGHIRLRFHRCPGCAYDLRATPTRCPECGMERHGTAAKEST